MEAPLPKPKDTKLNLDGKIEFVLERPQQVGKTTQAFGPPTLNREKRRAIRKLARRQARKDFKASQKSTQAKGPHHWGPSCWA